MSGVGIGFGALIVVLVSVYLLLGHLVRHPLGKVREMMLELGKGRLAKRLAMAQTDEIGETAEAMQVLAGQADGLRRLLAPFKLRESSVPFVNVVQEFPMRPPQPPLGPAAPAEWRAGIGPSPTIVLDDSGFGKY